MKTVTKTGLGFLGSRVSRAASAVLAAGMLFGCTDAPPVEQPPPSEIAVVGSVSFTVTDSTRDEDATAETNDKREILVTAFYPAYKGESNVEALCFPRPGEADLNAAAAGLPAGSFDTICEGEAFEGAEIAGNGQLPLVVFSHGYGAQIALYTSWLEALAHRGYIVLGLTHPYSAGITVLPSGAIAKTPKPPMDSAGFDALITKLSLDQQAAVGAFRNAAANTPNTPEGRLAARWDQTSVGFFGHSVGGAASALTCLLDKDADACANLDGTMEAATVSQGLDKPFLLVNASTNFAQDPSRPPLWENLRGAGYRLDLPAALHNNFSDMPFWIDRLQLPVDPAMMQVGKIDPTEARDMTLDFFGAFLDRHVQGMDAPLLDGPSPYANALWERR